jgi:hypothetical protein
MKKVVIAVAAGFAVVVTSFGPAFAATAHPSGPAIVRPVVVYSQPGWHAPQVKPAHFYDLTGDSSWLLKTPKWKSWTRTTAFSVGQFGFILTTLHLKWVKAYITLWRVRSHGNRRYFSRLKWVYWYKGHNHTIVRWFAANGAGGVLWVKPG